ncbi:hypothetical protein QBC39DRAFT_256722 [Podospora conica]|nr:hypothetical protein QBC39DRAFT_256722 [Schizothecium conicum]
MRYLPTLQLLLVAAAPIQAAFSWKNVRFGGGGGFSTGIVFHPTAKGVAYLRTDIGGLYRLNADDSWTPVTDSLATDAEWDSWGVDAVALDPQNPDKVYAALGLYTNDWSPNMGSIVRSSDRGATWSRTKLPFKVGGNMPGRGVGERLAVDPRNSSIIYFGARSGNGLWKSVDGAATFSKVSALTNTGTFIPDPSDVSGYQSDKQGLTFVTFDSTSELLNGATSRIFVGVADNTTASLYVSNDAGSTWSAVPGQPKAYFPHKCKVQPTEKALYLTYSDGLGPFDGTLGGVYRYDLTNGSWKDITPVSGSDLFHGFGGLGVDMQKPGTLLVASLNSWYPDAQLFRSTDSGATWTRIWEWGNYPEQKWYYGLNTDSAPWINAGFISQDTKRLGWMIEALEIDPLDSNHWLYATGLTVYGGRDLTKWDGPNRNVSISVMATGIEETAVLGLASAPGGSELLAAVGDVGGFTYKKTSDLDTPPLEPWMGPKFTTSTDVDYAGNKPGNVVRIGNAQGAKEVAVSTDGGVSWKAHPGVSETAHSGTAALSADADTIVWSSGNAGVLRSQNQGTFSAVASLPSGAVVAGDKADNAVFYGGSGSQFYRSVDTGATFAAVSGVLGSATAVRDIAAHPKIAGEVWVSTDIGLLKSTDFGKTFTPVGAGSLTNTHQIAFGLGAGSAWNVYAVGRGAAGAKLYASSDNGASWVDIQGDLQGFGNLSGVKLAGSGNSEGVVYVGTNGRGVFYAKGVVAGGKEEMTTTFVTTTVKATKTVTATTATPAITSATTPAASTTSTATASTVPAAAAQRWYQCGGIGWAGATACVSPWTCQHQNDWYHQCV